MEFHFQNQDAFTTTTTRSPDRNIMSRSENHGVNRRKYVGVRQRPSGKWVAEIKNTTQKIRMWLGTFDTAVEAAQAYDEAACLLRGSNTRTNFMNHVPCNPALALKIRNLLNQKKNINKIASLTTNSKSSSSSRTNILPPRAVSVPPPPPVVPTRVVHVEDLRETKLFDGAYKPDLNFFMTKEEKGSFQFDHSSAFTTDFDRILENEQEGLSESAHHKRFVGDIICGNENHDQTMTDDFEHLKVERQISASLYAMNGVNEYWENVNDSNDPFWHLPMLHQTFCSS